VRPYISTAAGGPSISANDDDDDDDDDNEGNQPHMNWNQ
jgi:hypothetical protein